MTDRHAQREAHISGEAAKLDAIFARNDEWNARHPALRAENLRRGDERAADYRAWVESAPRWTKMTPTVLGNRVDDWQEATE